MIKNDRQFRIVNARASRLDQLQQDLQARAGERPNDKRTDFELRAVSGELSLLRDELHEYEALKGGRVGVGEATTIGDISRLLIRARIASGLSQAQLAERLGMKEQQLQRYEATDYEGASLARLKEIGQTLNVRLGPRRNHEDELTVGGLLRRLESVGIDRSLVVKRIAPNLQQGREDASSVVTTAARIGRVFGWDLADLLSEHWHPAIEQMPAMAYKLPRSASTRRLKAYSAYARYLGELVLTATAHLEAKQVGSAAAVRQALVERGGVTFRIALEYVWDLGIAVLPLSDPGAFHATYIKQRGRGVIILKQLRRFESLWLFDLLHELAHAAETRGQPNLELIESPLRSESLGGAGAGGEATANAFARQVLFGDDGERLINLVWEKSAARPALFKRTVSLVARKENVDVGLLAYLIAHEARAHGHDWWATATSLQRASGDPWAKARDELLSRARLAELAPLDHELLVGAVRDGGNEAEREEARIGSET